jgi:RecA-family ATPase
MDSTEAPMVGAFEGLKEIAKEESRITVVSADEFAKSEPPPQEWLLKNSLPTGKTGMLVGMGGIGKSQLILALGVAVASGASVCGGAFQVDHDGSVLIFNAEDDQLEVHRRFRALVSSYSEAGIGKPNFSLQHLEWKKVEKHNSRLHFGFFAPGNNALCGPDGQQTELFNEVLDKAVQIDDLRLIVLDPLRRFLSGNEDSSEVVAGFIPIVERLSSETGATVLLVHHTSKQAAYKGSGHQFAARGSSALSDLVRWQVNLSAVSDPKKAGLPAEGDYLQITVSKNNYGPPQTEDVFLQRCDGGVLKYVHSSGHQDKHDKVVEMIVAFINDEFDKGRAYSKTDLRKSNVNLGTPLGQKAITGAVERGIELGLLTLVKRPNHKAKGKHPMDVLPAGCEHPAK